MCIFFFMLRIISGMSCILIMQNALPKTLSPAKKKKCFFKGLVFWFSLNFFRSAVIILFANAKCCAFTRFVKWSQHIISNYYLYKSLLHDPEVIKLRCVLNVGHKELPSSNPYSVVNFITMGKALSILGVIYTVQMRETNTNCMLDWNWRSKWHK